MLPSGRCRVPLRFDGRAPVAAEMHALRRRGRRDACPTLLAEIQHQPHDIALADQLAIDLNPLAKRDQVRRGEQPNAQSRRTVDAFEHRAGGAFAIRASDMNETQSVLRISRPRRELECVFQAQLQAEQTQIVKKPDGFGISHGVAVLLHGIGCMSLTAGQQ